MAAAAAVVVVIVELDVVVELVVVVWVLVAVVLIVAFAAVYARNIQDRHKCYKLSLNMLFCPYHYGTRICTICFIKHNSK